MIDIATLPANATATNPSVVFDWGIFAAEGYTQTWVDGSNLCAGLIQRTIPLQQSHALVLEAGLHTAVIHSLFTDARANRDDPLPLNSSDYKGWVGAYYLPQNQGAIDYGSRLWLRFYTKASSEPDDLTLEAQRFAAYESLTWLIDSGVIDSLEVDAQYIYKAGAQLLSLHIVMRRNRQQSPVYDAIWGVTLAHPEGYHAA